MIASYLKIAWRNIVRHKGHSAISIASLALGLAGFLLVTGWIRFERSYDRFHIQRRDIYLVVRENKGGDYVEPKAITGAPLAPLLRTNFPTIEQVVRLTCFRGEFVRTGDKQFLERRFFFADGSLFDVFTFPLVRGNPALALREPFTVVLTPETARKYFGEQDPINQVLRWTNHGRSYDFKVTGILAAIPTNSHLSFDFVASYPSLPVITGEWFMTRHWDSPTWTYVKLRPGTDPATLNRQLPAFTQRFVDKESYTSINHFLLPLDEVYFHSPGPAVGGHGNDQFLFIAAMISIFVLLIAMINYVNLATARAEQRTAEISLRKVAGARRWQLIGQFLGESVIESLLAAAIALLLLQLIQPVVNGFVGKVVPAGSFLGWGGLAVTILSAIAVGVLAGAYPALVLSAFSPMTGLKERYSKGSTVAIVRRVLVVGQFAFAVILIANVFLLSKQINFLQRYDLGFRPDNIILIPIRDQAVKKSYDMLKARWLQRSGITGVTASSMVPGVGCPNGINLSARGNPDTEMAIIYVDPDYFSTLGITAATGRGFSRTIPSDASGAVMLNQKCVQRLGWTDGVSEPMELFYKESGRNILLYQATVIGVVKDFHFRDLLTPMQPVLFKIDPRCYECIMIRLTGPDSRGTIEAIRGVWDSCHFDQPFEFTFLADELNGLYQVYWNAAAIGRWAGGLAIAIACLGLYGLAAFTISRKTKEIGVRKVLGASTPRITLMLTWNFSRWVLMANVIAWPVAWYVMQILLRNFPYHSAIEVGPFLFAGVLTLLMALLTVSIQAVKAAWANPVESLRYE